MEEKEEISAFLFCFFFPLSDRSEIRSRQIGPAEKKEAEAGTKRSFPCQSHTASIQRGPLPPRRENEVHVGLTLLKSLALDFERFQVKLYSDGVIIFCIWLKTTVLNRNFRFHTSHSGAASPASGRGDLTKCKWLKPHLTSERLRRQCKRAGDPRGGGEGGKEGKGRGEKQEGAERKAGGGRRERKRKTGGRKRRESRREGEGEGEGERWRGQGDRGYQ